MQNKYLERTSNEVCVGNTIEEISDMEYNSNLINNLKDKFGKSLGCEIKIVNVDLLTFHGYTTNRFSEQAT